MSRCLLNLSVLSYVVAESGLFKQAMYCGGFCRVFVYCTYNVNCIQGALKVPKHLDIL